MVTSQFSDTLVGRQGDSMTREQLVQRNPNILGGTPVFAGTRVPIKNLTDYLAGGYTLEEFLDDFPTVKREQAEGLLEQMKEDFLSRA